MRGRTHHFAYENVSGDGLITEVAAADDGTARLAVEVQCDNEDFLAKAASHPEEFMFSSRSRVARLGIEVEVTSPFKVQGQRIAFEARAFPIIPAFLNGCQLAEVLSPGMQIGRLFHDTGETLLDSEQLLAAIEERALMLPEGFSLSANGHVYLRCHRLVYDIREKLGRRELVTILTVPEGRARLDELQVARPVDHVVLRQGEGLITSCTVFLKDHFLVLDTSNNEFGQHSKATILDPLKTRGPRILLEIFNPGKTPVVDPIMRCRVHRAVLRKQPKVQLSVAGSNWPFDYERLRETFDRMLRQPDAQTELTANKTAAMICGEEDLRKLASETDTYPHAANTGPFDLAQASSPLRFLSPHTYGSGEVLAGWDREKPGTLLLNYFPNNDEFLTILAPELRDRVQRVIFRNASFNHRQFLSSGDHGRLRTLSDLGIEVLWLNDQFQEVSRHVMSRGIGYFMRPEFQNAFARSIFFAFYGTGGELTPRSQQKIRELIEGLAEFFGGEIGILTGGGSGVMGFANHCAKEMGLISGASFLAIDEQPPNLNAIDFYQFFQSNARHNRQKWFELCQFQIFNIGGAGTLEEVGITLCNVKLGVIQRSPLVFFGCAEEVENGHSHPSGLYWDGLRQQIECMDADHRIPGWLAENVHFTDTAEKALAFYRKRLEIA